MRRPLGAAILSFTALHVLAVPAFGQLATPTLTTTAAPQNGAKLHDVAHLSGGDNPTGDITFALFGPDDPTCSVSAGIPTGATVNGNGDYVSGDVTVPLPGTYQWTAVYSGDGLNNDVVVGCNAPNESVVVVGASPTLTTTASPSVAVGEPLFDFAHLSGGNSPGGGIDFRLYGPTDATCALAPIFLTTVLVNGNGTYVSAPFTAPAPGAYRWTATYSGDGLNNPVATTCNDAGEAVLVPAQVPTLGAAAFAILAALIAGFGTFMARG